MSSDFERDTGSQQAADARIRSESRLEGGRRSGGGGAEPDGSDVVVSVVIASFNCVDVIEGAIKSVLDQTFTSKELIVIDGGSSDGTVDVLEKHNDAIDYWVSQPDNGVYDALNKGIGLARGTWLYFLGADDRLFDKNTLLRIFSHQVRGEMLYGNVILKGTGVVGENDQVYDGKFSRLKLCNKNICHQAIFYRKTLFERLGTYDLRYQLMADYAFNIKVFGQRGLRATYIDNVVSVYNAEGKSSNNSDVHFAEDKLFLIKRYFGRHIYFWLLAVRNFLIFRAKMESALAKIIKGQG